MTYQPYLISKYASALDKSTQPWLLPDEAQESLYDGFVYRGEWCKRPGYNPFAIGQISNIPYTESRMVKNVASAATVGAINSTNTTYTITATGPLRRGTFSVIGTSPSQSLTDNGLGYFLAPTVNISAISNANPAVITTSAPNAYVTGAQVVITNVGGIDLINSPVAYTITVLTTTTFSLNGVDSTLSGSYTTGGTSQQVVGSIDYSTGVVSVSFPTAPTAGSVTATYDYHPGLPVMMVANFYTATNIRQLILCDTQNVNRYNPATNRLDDISPASPFTGDETNFFSWVNYEGPDGAPRLLFVNNQDPIQQYDGTTVSTYAAYAASTIVTNEAYGTGNGSGGPYIHTAANLPVVLQSVTITAGSQSVSDDGAGNFVGSGTGTINYLTGAMSVTFSSSVSNPVGITVNYSYQGAALQTALHLFNVKDRLVILRPTNNAGTILGKRIMISGTGVFSDTFSSEASGAGIIDIPDASWIFSAAFNRDDLIIFTENSTWIMKYKDSDVVPFNLDKLDDSRGSGAPYSGITYLNRTTTLSPRGLIITDGYRVERADEKIPSFSFDNINQTLFPLCFAGSVDQDRDHYLIYPSASAEASDQILVTNYEEDNYCIYKIPLSCMGSFIEAYDCNWNDLLSFSNWDEMADRFGTWNSFAYTKGLPFAIGGGHNGEVWRMNVNGIEDNPCKIRSMTVIDPFTLQIETDFQNWSLGDYVFLDGITGMEEANDKQGAIKNIIMPNYVFQIDISTMRFSNYDFGGTVSRIIPFQSTTKKFNPFVQQSQKVRCGYLYFYVNSSEVGTKRNVNIDAISQTNPAVVQANNHQFSTGDLIGIFGVSGMLQINGIESTVTVIDPNNFSVDAINSTAFAAYASGGVAAGPENCFIDVDVIVNDSLQNTQVANSSLVMYEKPYRVTCTPNATDRGEKKWVKIYINQVGRFIQFRVSNTQALSTIKIQAMMPGFCGVGRLI